MKDRRFKATLAAIMAFAVVSTATIPYIASDVTVSAITVDDVNNDTNYASSIKNLNSFVDKITDTSEDDGTAVIILLNDDFVLSNGVKIAEPNSNVYVYLVDKNKVLTKNSTYFEDVSSTSRINRYDDVESAVAAANAREYKVTSDGSDLEKAISNGRTNIVLDNSDNGSDFTIKTGASENASKLVAQADTNITFKVGSNNGITLTSIAGAEYEVTNEVSATSPVAGRITVDESEGTVTLAIKEGENLEDVVNRLVAKTVVDNTANTNTRTVILGQKDDYTCIDSGTSYVTSADTTKELDISVTEGTVTVKPLAIGDGEYKVTYSNYDSNTKKLTIDTLTYKVTAVEISDEVNLTDLLKYELSDGKLKSDVKINTSAYYTVSDYVAKVATSINLSNSKLYSHNGAYVNKDTSSEYIVDGVLKVPANTNISDLIDEINTTEATGSPISLAIGEVYTIREDVTPFSVEVTNANKSDGSADSTVYVNQYNDSSTATTSGAAFYDTNDWINASTIKGKTVGSTTVSVTIQDSANGKVSFVRTNYKVSVHKAINSETTLKEALADAASDGSTVLQLADSFEIKNKIYAPYDVEIVLGNFKLTNSLNSAGTVADSKNTNGSLIVKTDQTVNDAIDKASTETIDTTAKVEVGKTLDLLESLSYSSEITTVSAKSSDEKVATVKATNAVTTGTKASASVVVTGVTEGTADITVNATRKVTSESGRVYYKDITYKVTVQAAATVVTNQKELEDAVIKGATLIRLGNNITLSGKVDVPTTTKIDLNDFTITASDNKSVADAKSVGSNDLAIELPAGDTSASTDLDAYIIGLANTAGVKTEGELNAAIKSNTSGVINVRLDDDIELSEDGVTLPAGSTLIVDLNGHNITTKKDNKLAEVTSGKVSVTAVSEENLVDIIDGTTTSETTPVETTVTTEASETTTSAGEGTTVTTPVEGTTVTTEVTTTTEETTVTTKAGKETTASKKDETTAAVTTTTASAEETTPVATTKAGKETTSKKDETTKAVDTTTAKEEVTTSAAKEEVTTTTSAKEETPATTTTASTKEGKKVDTEVSTDKDGKTSVQLAPNADGSYPDAEDVAVYANGELVSPKAYTYDQATGTIVFNDPVDADTDVEVYDTSDADTTEATTTSAKEETPATSGVKGDSNGDKVVDAIDILNVKKYLLQMIDLDDEAIKNCDVVGDDGQVQANDLLQIKKFVLQMIDEF